MNQVVRIQYWPRSGELPPCAEIERIHRERSYERVTRASARRLAAVCRRQLAAGRFRAGIYATGWGMSLP